MAKSIVEKTREEIAPQQTYFLGVSMGGICALAASTMIDQVDGVLAFSPQYSPFYKFVPEENRLRKFRHAIPERLFRFISTSSVFKRPHYFFMGTEKLKTFICQSSIAI